MKNIITSRINVMVSNIDSAIAFYTSTLGFDFLNRYGNHYAEIQAPNLLIGLHPNSKNSLNGNNMSIGFGVIEFDVTIKELEEKGVKLAIENDEWVQLAHFTDPDNNQLFLLKIYLPRY